VLRPAAHTVVPVSKSCLSAVVTSCYPKILVISTFSALLYLSSDRFTGIVRIHYHDLLIYHNRFLSKEFVQFRGFWKFHWTFYDERLLPLCSTSPLSDVRDWLFHTFTVAPWRLFRNEGFTRNVVSRNRLRQTRLCFTQRRRVNCWVRVCDSDATRLYF
jgi:hypothetical protein